MSDAIRPIVARHFPNASLIGITRLTGGVSADVYRLELDAPDGKRSVVLRLHGAQHAGHSAALEFALLEALTACGLDVPAPLAFGDPAQAPNNSASASPSARASEDKPAPYVVIAHIEGSTAIAPDVAPARIAAMAAALAEIHSVPIAGLPDLPRRTDPRPYLVATLPVVLGYDPAREALAALDNTDFHGAPSLLHGDFWPENIIWQGGVIASVIDWEDAAIGDPVSDVACTWLELRYLFGVPGAQAFRTAYEGHKSLPAERFTLWLAYVAAGALRHMGDWGLPAEKHDHMRALARLTVDEAVSRLNGHAP